MLKHVHDTWFWEADEFVIEPDVFSMLAVVEEMYLKVVK